MKTKVENTNKHILLQFWVCIFLFIQVLNLHICFQMNIKFKSTIYIFLIHYFIFQIFNNLGQVHYGLCFHPSPELLKQTMQVFIFFHGRVFSLESLRTRTNRTLFFRK